MNEWHSIKYNKYMDSYEGEMPELGKVVILTLRDDSLLISFLDSVKTKNGFVKHFSGCSNYDDYEDAVCLPDYVIAWMYAPLPYQGE